MRSVIYKTENGIFEINLDDATERLNFYAKKHRIHEAADQLYFLTNSHEDHITIPEEKSYFGYVVMDLIKKNKCSVYCHSCQAGYQCTLLKSIPVGHGESPLSVNTAEKRGFFKRVFGRKRRLPGMMGGGGYECPKGHELIAMIMWRT